MKTIEEIQDEVASEYKDSHDFKYSKWVDLEGYLIRCSDYDILKIAWLEVCNRYAIEVAKASLG